MQRTLQRALFLSAALTCVLLLGAAPIGMAHDSNSGSGSGSSGSSRGSGKTSVVTTNSAEDENEHGGGDDLSGDHASLRSRAELFLEDRRQDTERHTKPQRQKACEARRHGIYIRAGKFGDVAQTHLDKLNSAFTKVQAFQTAKQLDVANYEDLVAAAAAKQTAAQTAVDELKALNTEIDCEQDDPAAHVAEIKTAASDARKALKAYRTAIKDVVSALRGALPSDDGVSEGKQ